MNIFLAARTENVSVWPFTPCASWWQNHRDLPVEPVGALPLVLLALLARGEVRLPEDANPFPCPVGRHGLEA